MTQVVDLQQAVSHEAGPLYENGGSCEGVIYVQVRVAESRFEPTILTVFRNANPGTRFLESGDFHAGGFTDPRRCVALNVREWCRTGPDRPRSGTRKGWKPTTRRREGQGVCFRIPGLFRATVLWFLEL